MTRADGMILDDCSKSFVTPVWGALAHRPGDLVTVRKDAQLCHNIWNTGSPIWGPYVRPGMIGIVLALLPLKNKSGERAVDVLCLFPNSLGWIFVELLAAP